jgi:hypothetical protein
MLKLLAIHEAGHEIYYVMAGCTILGFESPRIISSVPTLCEQNQLVIGNELNLMANRLCK